MVYTSIILPCLFYPFFIIFLPFAFSVSFTIPELRLKAKGRKIIMTCSEPEVDVLRR